MKNGEYINIPSILKNRWESGVGELVNQMGLQNVLIIGNVEDQLDDHIYYANINRCGTSHNKLPYRDNTFDAVILMYASRIDDRFDQRLIEMKRVCKHNKYIFVVDTINQTKGIAKTICSKWVKESRKDMSPKAVALFEPAAMKETMERAGLKRPYMRKLFLGTCSVFTASKW